MKIKKHLATATLALSLVAGSVLAAAPAQAATASQYVWGSNAAECRHNAQRYAANWAYGYDAAIIPPCKYDSGRGQWWTKVTLYY